MQAIPVGVRRVDAGRVEQAAPVLDLAADLRKADQFAKLLDSQFSIAGVQFGLDALIGLVPIAGDVASTLIGMYPVYLARKHKLGKIVVGRMIANLAVDFGVGLVPLAGDAVDVLYKANRRNFKLLRAAAIKRDPTLRV